MVKQTERRHIFFFQKCKCYVNSKIDPGQKHEIVENFRIAIDFQFLVFMAYNVDKTNMCRNSFLKIKSQKA